MASCWLRPWPLKTRRAMAAIAEPRALSPHMLHERMAGRVKTLPLDFRPLEQKVVGLLRHDHSVIPYHIAQTHALLHGAEKQAYADASYLGVEKREEIATGSPDVEWHVAAKRSKVKAMARPRKEPRQRIEVFQRSWPDDTLLSPAEKKRYSAHRGA